MPALDGLRGIAIIVVMLFHIFRATPSAGLVDKVILHVASVGWIGVDLFFVLSGFLITGILIDAKNSVTFFTTFYSRRALRIVPAYVTFVLFSIWLAPRLGFLSVAAAKLLREQQLWYWAFAVNFLIAFHGWSVVPSSLSPLWSLSVEEQFYLLWPATVLLLSVTALRRLAIAAFLAAEVIRALVIAFGLPDAVNFVTLPSRMDTLAVGSFLACAFRTPALWGRVMSRRKLVTSCAVGALLLVLASFRSLDVHEPLTQLLAFPALALLGGLCVATATGDVRPLAHPALRFFGRYSYAMYLWHGTFIGLLSIALSRAGVKTFLGTNIPFYVLIISSVFLATIVAALTSWHLVERPCLELKQFFRYRPAAVHAARE